MLRRHTPIFGSLPTGLYESTFEIILTTDVDLSLFYSYVVASLSRYVYAE
jgi:hypothetical protein